MSDAATKSAIANIVKAVSRNATVLNELKQRNLMMDEVINNIYQRVEDMSKKFDEVLNVGMTKPNASPKKAESKSPPKKGASKSPPKKSVKKKPKTATNIMAFFKSFVVIVNFFKLFFKSVNIVNAIIDCYTYSYSSNCYCHHI